LSLIELFACVLKEESEPYNGSHWQRGNTSLQCCRRRRRRIYFPHKNQTQKWINMSIKCERLPVEPRPSQPVAKNVATSLTTVTFVFAFISLISYLQLRETLSIVG